MKIYVINLDRDVERLAWMDKQLKSLDIEYERFSALTPQTIPASIRARFNERAHDVLLPNNVACFSSHIAVAEEFLKTDQERCLVLEDDVEIEANKDEIFALMDASSDLDMLKLNDWPKTPSVHFKGFHRFSVIRYLQVPRGTGSYVLTRRGAERFLKCAVGLAISTDNFIRSHGYVSLDIAGVIPPPIPQDRFGVSSLDPEKKRGKHRNRRYFQSSATEVKSANLTNRTLGLIRTVGLGDTLLLLALKLRMSIRGVKRDRNAEYVLKRAPSER